MDAHDSHGLQLGDELGEGGQATVFALAADPTLAFKRYLNPSAAQRLEPFIEDLHRTGGSITVNGRPVREWAAWPMAKVVENGQFVGFLMPLADPRFRLHVGGRDRLADLSYLASEPKPMWGPVQLPNNGERLQVLGHLASAVQALHDRGLVLGDISFGNVLWSISPQPAVMLLDCDGITREGAASVTPSLDTMDWNDPHSQRGAPADQDRDRYKLALAILRVLTRSLSLRPDEYQGQSLFVPEEFSDARLRSLIPRAAGPVGTRPTAAEWRMALSLRHTVAVSQPVPASAPLGPAPKPGLLIRNASGRKTRPVGVVGPK